MRRLNSVSSALAWVKNGRARAPPACGCRMGVSTSTKACASSRSRRMESVLKRMSKTRRLSLLASRSTSRWRYLVSASFRPYHLSGSGRSALARISRPVTSMDSSPRRLVITSPVTPTQSPRSTSASTAAASSGQVVGLEHQLNGAVGVLDGDEPELAVTPHGHHPPGDPGHLARPRVRLQPGVARLQVGQRRGALEPGGVGVDALGLERVALGAAFGYLRGQPPRTAGSAGSRL